MGEGEGLSRAADSYPKMVEIGRGKGFSLGAVSFYKMAETGGMDESFIKSCSNNLLHPQQVPEQHKFPQQLPQPQHLLILRW